MGDHIDFGGKPWTAIPRAILRDPDLSARAKGGLVTLLSHDEGWVRSCIAILMKQNAGCGRTQAQGIMSELRDAGYATLEKRRTPNGRFETSYTVTPYRQENTVELIFPPQTGDPATVEPSTVEGAAVVEPREGDPEVGDPQTPKADAGTSGAVVVSDRWPYFLQKLQAQDDVWDKVTIGACVKIAQETDSEAVSTALSFAATNAPIIEGSAYGWLRNAARGLKEARETA